MVSLCLLNPSLEEMINLGNHLLHHRVCATGNVEVHPGLLPIVSLELLCAQAAFLQEVIYTVTTQLVQIWDHISLK